MRREVLVVVLVSFVSIPAAQVSAQPMRSQAPGIGSIASSQNGTSVTVVGELAVLNADDFANRRASTAYFVRDEQTGRWIQLKFENSPPHGLRSGTRIRVTGSASTFDASSLYVAACCDATSSNLQALSASAASPSGDQRALVMVGNFLDENVGCTTDAIDRMLFAAPTGTFDMSGTGLSVNAQYQDSSHGKVSWSGRVTGPFTLNSFSTDACDLGTWASALNADAQAAGIDLSSYPHLVYVFPEVNTCSRAGFGTVGGNPSYAYIGSCTFGVFSHELGHNLGMNHAGSIDGTGAFNEYGDVTDPMALATWQMKGFNAPHREEMGWLAATGTAAARLVTQSGVYNVAPLSADPAMAPQVLKIAKPDSGEYYYLSYRIPQGFDNYMPGWYQNKLSVTRYSGTSAVTSDYTYLLNNLADGESFTDAANGIKVTAIGHNASYLTVAVDFGCTAATPLLTVSPQTQSGVGGTTLSYAVSLANRDTAGCAASTIALGVSAPAGWGSAVSPSNLTLAPGATGHAVLTVTSAAAAAPSGYDATVATSDPTQALHATSVTATYSVPDTVAPSAPSKLTAIIAKAAKQIRLSWTAATDNVGVAGYRVWRNGSVVGTSATTGWSDSAYKAGATYTYYVVALDAAGNISPASNVASVTISGGVGKK